MHVCHRVLVERHLHTVVSTESSSCSGEGTWPVFTSVTVVVVHRQWACIFSSHGCECLSNANAITVFCLFSLFSKERLGMRTSVLTPCGVCGHAWPQSPGPASCAWLLLLQGWMHGYVCSSNGSDLCRMTGKLGMEARCVEWQ